MTMAKLIQIKHFGSSPNFCIAMRMVHASQSMGQQKTEMPTKNKATNVVLLDAVRTPFVLSNTVFRELLAVDLQRHALKGFPFCYYQKPK
jgi:hypothetical protein